MLIVLTTTTSIDEAEALAEKIVDARLAACVQIMPQMTSIYVWEGKRQKQGEHLLLIKTLNEKWEDLAAFIDANHSYSIPEIVGVGAEKVSGAYLAWMRSVVGSQ